MFNTAFRDAVESIRPTLSVISALASAAAEGALGLPPPLPPTSGGADLIALSIVLSTLCKAAYTATVEDVGRVTAVTVPGHTEPVAATLLHFREAHAAAGATGDAAAGGPQQYGIWRVRGLTPGEPSSLVVAFRGTATRHDALVDAAIAPSRLGRGDDDDGTDDDDPGYATGLAAHHGFLTGARRHARDIAAHVARFNGRGAAGRGPVWLTGHSLGGAYAVALALELLARRDGSAARFFGGGGEGTIPSSRRLAGGVITFGSPMVWVGPPEPPRIGSGRRRAASSTATAPPPSPPRPAVRAAHARLAALESAHACALREAGVRSPRPLTWAGFVNGADIVPRALGSPLGGVAAVLGRTVPWLAPARAAAARYRPVGSTLLIVGSTVRATGASPAAGGGLGSASTSDAAAAALHAGRAWTAAAAGAAAVKAESAHDLGAYTAGLTAYAQALLNSDRPVPAAAPAASPPAGRRRRPAATADGEGDPLAAACDMATAAGRTLGDASAAAAMRLRDAAARTAASTWRAAAAAAVVAVSARMTAARAGVAAEPVLAAAGAGGGSGVAVVVEEEEEEDEGQAPAPPPRRRRLFGRKGGVT